MTLLYVHYDPATGLIESIGNCEHSMHREDLLIVELDQQPDPERQRIDVSTGNLINLTEQEILDRVVANENAIDPFLVANKQE